jgi:hypothetical protein
VINALLLLVSTFALAADAAFTSTLSGAAGGAGSPSWLPFVNDTLLPLLLTGVIGKWLYDHLLGIAAKLGVNVDALSSWIVRCGVPFVATFAAWVSAKAFHHPLDTTALGMIGTVLASSASMLIVHHAGDVTGGNS